jgi:hypothetical protein
MTQKTENNVVSIILLMVIVACTRFITIPGIGAGQNFTALGGLAIFSGIYFKPMFKAIGVTLLTYLISDLVINVIIYKGQYGIMYSGFYIQYILIAAISLLTNFIVKKISVVNVLGTSVLGSVLFFIGSNFAVWASGTIMPGSTLPYEKTFSGLMVCYANGLPFFTNFLVSTSVSALVMVGVQQFISTRKVLSIA